LAGGPRFSGLSNAEIIALRNGIAGMRVVEDGLRRKNYDARGVREGENASQTHGLLAHIYHSITRDLALKPSRNSILIYHSHLIIDKCALMIVYTIILCYN